MQRFDLLPELEIGEWITVQDLQCPINCSKGVMRVIDNGSYNLLLNAKLGLTEGDFEPGMTCLIFN